MCIQMKLKMLLTFTCFLSVRYLFIIFRRQTREEFQPSSLNVAKNKKDGMKTNNVSECPTKLWLFL